MKEQLLINREKQFVKVTVNFQKFNK